jgi:hypothetical protein
VNALLVEFFDVDIIDLVLPIHEVRRMFFEVVRTAQVLKEKIGDQLQIGKAKRTASERREW